MQLRDRELAWFVTLSVPSPQIIKRDIKLFLKTFTLINILNINVFDPRKQEESMTENLFDQVILDTRDNGSEHSLAFCISIG